MPESSFQTQIDQTVGVSDPASDQQKLTTISGLALFSLESESMLEHPPVVVHHYKY